MALLIITVGDQSRSKTLNHVDSTVDYNSIIVVNGQLKIIKQDATEVTITDFLNKVKTTNNNSMLIISDSSSTLDDPVVQQFVTGLKATYQMDIDPTQSDDVIAMNFMAKLLEMNKRI